MNWDIGRQFPENVQMFDNIASFSTIHVLFFFTNLDLQTSFGLLGGAWEVRQSLRLVCQRGGVLRKEGPKESGPRESVHAKTTKADVEKTWEDMRKLIGDWCILLQNIHDAIFGHWS